MTSHPLDDPEYAAVFTPSPVDSLIDLMRQAQLTGIPMMKATMENDAWVMRPFNPRVVGDNRSDAPAERKMP